MSGDKDFKTYLSGFALSIILTLAAYFAVRLETTAAYPVLSHNALLLVILGLAFVQLVIQLLYFLHLDKERRPRWNLVAFISTIALVLVVIVGSIWIMYHLNYNMTPQQIQQYLQQGQGAGY